MDYSEGDNGKHEKHGGLMRVHTMLHDGSRVTRVHEMLHDGSKRDLIHLLV